MYPMGCSALLLLMLFSMLIGDAMQLSKMGSHFWCGDLVGGVCWRTNPKSPVAPPGPWGQTLP